MAAPEWLEEAEALRSRGLTHKRIAAEVGTTYAQVYYWLRQRKHEGRELQRYRDKTSIERECKSCGEPFKIEAWISTLQGRGRFCSQQCANDYQRRKPRKCSECRKEFDAGPPSVARKTCSKECARKRASRLKRGRRNPNWVATTEEERWHMARRLFCAWCGEQKPWGGPSGLHLHHVVYAQTVRLEGGDMWSPWNALTLCCQCHTRHHRSGENKLPVEKLRDENFDFAVGLLGIDKAYVYLRRHYKGEDERLLALGRGDGTRWDGSCGSQVATGEEA